jgi:hypothetical protein
LRFGAWALDAREPAAGPSETPVLHVPALLPAADISAFAATLFRPLFREDRRPAAAPQATQSGIEAAATSEPPPANRLIAVAIGPDRRAAILQLTAGGTAVLLQGEQTGGWTLADVAPDQVTLRAGERSARLLLPPAASRK